MNKYKILKQFGINLKHIRQKRNLTQEELAYKIGAHRTYIGLVERGKRSISLFYIVRIANVLNISISKLFKGLIINND